MLIKICGLRDPEVINNLSKLKPDYMGFDFRSTSARYIGEVDETLLYPIEPVIRKIGIFENEDTITILSKAGRYGLNAIQIEGQKDAQAIEMLSAEGLEVIKVIDLCDQQSINRGLQWDGVVHKFLFRIPSPQQVKLLDKWQGCSPFFISANWNEINIDDVLRVASDRLCGLDIHDNSSFGDNSNEYLRRIDHMINKIRNLQPEG